MLRFSSVTDAGQLSFCLNIQILQNLSAEIGLWKFEILTVLDPLNNYASSQNLGYIKSIENLKNIRVKTLNDYRERRRRRRMKVVEDEDSFVSMTISCCLLCVLVSNTQYLMVMLFLLVQREGKRHYHKFTIMHGGGYLHC